MKLPSTLSLAIAVALPIFAQTAWSEVVELSFDSSFEKPGVLREEHAPEWLTNIEQEGGAFLDDPRGWHVAANAQPGVGQLEISLDRKKVTGNLVVAVLFDTDDTGDLSLQLFDAEGKVVAADLFGNLVDVGKEAITDTFVIPLGKYPTATKVVFERIRGELQMYGVALFPVDMEGTPAAAEMKKLADALGDPLSLANPLSKSLTRIAKNSKIAVDPALSAPPKNTTPAAAAPRRKYAAAQPPAAGLKVAPAPEDGLVGYWNMAHGDASDASGHGRHGQMRGGVVVVDGLHGKALKLRKNPTDNRDIPWDAVTLQPTPDLNLKENLTVSAWVKYSTIARRWGSQIVWFGDSQFGRDPWDLHILPDGTLEFRTDRSVTGKPVFTVHNDEIKLSPKGEKLLNQHVSVQSPDILAPETWYFVTGTGEKISPRMFAFKLYVNGEQVGEVKTEETVNYPSEQMWMTIGGVDKGTWQNFDGLVEEVRVYKRALSPAEIQTLYRQPWAAAK